MSPAGRRRLAHLVAVVALPVMIMMLMSVKAEPTPVRPFVCGPDESLVLHGVYGAYSNVTIAVDSSKIEEQYSFQGRDYGIVIGADAKTAWRIDENGAETRSAGGAEADLMTLRALLCGDVPSAQAALQVVVERNAESGDVARVVYRVDGSLRAIEVLRYGSLRNGEVVPVAWRTEGGEMFLSSSEALENRPLDPNEFPWRKPNITITNGAFALKISGGRFYLPGSLDNVPISCMIDTGTSYLAVSNDLAGHIDQSDWTLERTRVIGGTEIDRVGRVNVLNVAGSTFLHPVVYVDSRLPPRTVICGGDYLSRLRLHMDFGSHRALVAVAAASRYQCKTGCVSIDQSGVANGNATIGGKTFPVMFDSGYVGAVRMPPADFAAISSSSSRQAAPYCSGATRVSTIALGGVTNTTTVCPVLEDASIPIAVGARTFATYGTVVIDYPDHLLQFTK